VVPDTSRLHYITGGGRKYHTIDPYAVGNGKHGEKPAKPPADYKKRYDGLGAKCGLDNMSEKYGIETYLRMNGNFTMLPVSVFCFV
jgi:hypothetical protein